MNILEIINFFAIPSLFLGIIGLFYAIYQGKKAKTAEKKITDLMQAMTSYKYLKELAFSHYSNGKYDESLDVFKKYLLENKDENEWNDIILQIMIKETAKLYSNILVFSDGKLPKFTLLVQAFISHEETLSKTQYPVILKTLINDYIKNFKRNRSLSEFLIALFDNDWTKAKDVLLKLEIGKSDDINDIFKQYAIEYLNSKLNKQDDNFVDDIPF